MLTEGQGIFWCATPSTFESGAKRILVIARPIFLRYQSPALTKKALPLDTLMKKITMSPAIEKYFLWMRQKKCIKAVCC
jgi:hypothetical protein